MEDIYIVGAARTAIADFGGALKDKSPADLGVIVAKAALERAGLEAADVQNVVMGQVMPTEPRDAYLARMVGVNAGVPIEAPALTLNRLCGSGVEAIVTGAKAMMLGEADIVLAGGAEVMSRVPHVVKGARWGTKMGNVEMTDGLIEALSDPFDGVHMGITAENVAERYQITREAQDALALQGHQRAARAIAEGRFKAQIVPVEVKTRKGVVAFDTDEHVRADVSAEELAKLRPVFKKDGSVTAANASGINDAAAMVVLATKTAVDAKGLKPLARILGWGHAGVEPLYMGIGPVKAVPIALRRAGLTLDDIDVIEANEAFAAQACAVAQELGFNPEKVNPNGSGVALGHPVGATGTILTVKTIYELERIDGRYGLITMCIGGGQGIAMVVERCA
ncbi:MULTISPECIES: beta-ketothiolase BktB [unclassified Sphingomonas]|uniref:beta-ketothiolase BktB n=1 Tax=unclassified Sphingomonas TaxID=196159 RepID=UPI0006FFAF6E|nr:MULTISPECIES: beta-ketothiolase BktB [unclassified Sphingomonas]KQX25405.1 acetyl-CoA acetyltransferase [Sphingomonas sp. Root1294]KQY66397.1 acetyl-CoA acetyltransferase [Sphingomonas sp. Root50]KRB90286.1 acetyl-CoA acetyltransferase [Sphingomonas sp. Root720]